jgi:uncharacterized protein (TIGR02145 family)
MSGIDFTNPAVSKNQQASFVVSREPAVSNPAAITYRWSAPDFSPATHEGRTYMSTAPATPGTYSVTLTAQSEGYCPLAITKVVEVVDCHAPGSTVNFTAFAPCEGAATGATWTLQDTRETSNNQSYKVKKMTDGHIWMVQDMKFGDKCNKTTFSGSTVNQQGKVSATFPDYYGDCKNGTLTNVGYYYDWAAAINKANAYNGSSANVGCSGTGTAAFACQGLCPSGWHVPTYDEMVAFNLSLGTNCSSAQCWHTNALFEMPTTGYVNASGGLGYTNYAYLVLSTMYDASKPYMCDGGQGGNAITVVHVKSIGMPVRCVRNY